MTYAQMTLRIFASLFAGLSIVFIAGGLALQWFSVRFEEVYWEWVAALPPFPS